MYLLSSLKAFKLHDKHSFYVRWISLMNETLLGLFSFHYLTQISQETLISLIKLKLRLIAFSIEHHDTIIIQYSFHYCYHYQYQFQNNIKFCDVEFISYMIYHSFKIRSIVIKIQCFHVHSHHKHFFTIEYVCVCLWLNSRVNCTLRR